MLNFKEFSNENKIVGDNSNILNKEEYFDVVSESLPRQRSVDQLERVMKASEKTDIGNRIGLEGGNLHFAKNPIKSGIESYEDFEKKNKSFISGWNTKNLLSPFK